MPTKETVEHIICPEGRFWRETRTRYEIEPGAAIAKVLSKQQSLRIPRVMQLKNYGFVGLHYEASTANYWWTIPITFINLRCEFRPITDEETKENLLAPKFAYNKDSTDVIMVKWPVMSDAKANTPNIYLLIQCVDNGIVSPGYQYLIATDIKGNPYQLPMGNIYEHLQLCCGEYPANDNTHQGVIARAIEQFETSKWNTDLYHSGQEKATNDFFRFRPLREGFEALPIKGDWTKVCEKRSVQQTSYIVI